MIQKFDVKSRETLDKIKTYIPGMPIWEVKKLYGLSSVVKLASNENPLGPSPKVIQAIHSSLAELHRYPDSKLDLSQNQLIVTNGGDELIKLLSETFLEPEDEIVLPSPTFSEYEFGADLMGAVIKSVPFDDEYRFDISAILSALSERTKLVYICSPNNPTGTYLPREDLKRLLDQLPDGILVVLDSAYSHYATAEDFTNGVEFVRLGYPIVVLQTFSKIYALAGIRVGFGAAPENVIQKILKVKEPFNVNALAQVAATAALEDHEHFQKSLLENSIGREQLYKAFEELRIPFTESMANFILAEVGPNAELIYNALLKRGVIVRYGATFGLPNHIRFSIGAVRENEFLIQTLREVMYS
ncbi:histidinol-phosphate transaminase [Brevibacillus borstelensis]|uniref:histidinol-phosphate transaminase n=1 Tax=Brevibacillus borstelensis TaxID=45462 RepID=UPI0030C00547